MSEQLKERVDEGAQQIQQKASEAKVKTRGVSSGSVRRQEFGQKFSLAETADP